MSVKLQIAAMLLLMIQAVLFGAGVIAVLSTDLATYGFSAIVAVTLVSAAIAVPLSWKLAAYLHCHTRGYRIAG